MPTSTDSRSRPPTPWRSVTGARRLWPTDPRTAGGWCDVSCAVADRHAEAVQIAIAASVQIACGTDIWGAGMWGRNGEELSLLVKLGMDPLAAVEAATAMGPLTVGPQASPTGRLEAGFAADIITVDGDPLQDIAVLADSDRITAVWKDGLRVK